MNLGAHVSIAGGLEKSVERAKNIGAGCVQIFGSSPQSFNTTNYAAEDFANFRKAAKDARITPIFFHGVYLINLASEQKRLYDLSIKSLIHYLNLCGKVGAEGVVFHIGSRKENSFGLVKGRIMEALVAILKASPTGKLILENNAGQGGGVGMKFNELAQLLEGVKSDRVGICLDTQHAFAAGYDVSSAEGLKNTLVEFEQEVGLPKLVAIHLNDSKFPLGSKRDRHENIGQGLIGLGAFGRILNNPRLSHLPFIIETPGFEGTGPDKKNLDILKDLVK